MNRTMNLTRDKIQTLEAGQEMDRLVCQHVFGWKDFRYCRRTKRRSSANEGYWQGVEPENGYEWPVPPYSHSMHGWSIGLIDWLDNRWGGFVLIHATKWYCAPNVDQVLRASCGQGETPCLAICRAALLEVVG